MSIFLGILCRRASSEVKFMRKDDILRFITYSAVRCTSDKSASFKRSRNRKDNPIKILNWQNRRLFGPLIKLKTSKKQDQELNTEVNKKTKEQILNTFDGIKKHIKVKNSEHKNTNNKNSISSKTQELNSYVDSFNNIKNDSSEINLDVSSIENTEKVMIPNTFPMIIIGNETHNNANENALQYQVSSLLQHTKTDADERLYIPSVTTVLNKSMSLKSLKALEEWRKKMIEKLGEEGFTKYQEDIFQVGSALHSQVQDYLEGKAECDIDFHPETIGYWQSLKNILPRVTDPLLIETKVEHPYLRYKGVIDCIAKYKNKTVLIEWKTSGKQKPLLRNTFDNPLQLAAYIGAVNFSKKLSFQIDSGLIVVCYPNGVAAHAHFMSPEQCLEAWKQWLTRLEQYWQQRNSQATVNERENCQGLPEATLEFSERSGFTDAIIN